MTASAPYYAQSRPEMLSFVPASTRRLLDIGCGEGAFGAAVKHRLPDCEVWGIEPVASAAAVAARSSDRIIANHIEDTPDLPSGHFDVITLNDVLEHLPWSEPVLKLVTRLLKPDGLLVMSIPNVRFFLNVRDLLFRGEWEYQDYGILDRTHFRFFTKKSVVRLLMRNGFDVVQAVGINPVPLKLHYRVLFALAPRSFADMAFPQFAVVSRPGRQATPDRA